MCFRTNAHTGQNLEVEGKCGRALASLKPRTGNKKSIVLDLGASFMVRCGPP